jgi:hypothetical protein
MNDRLYAAREIETGKLVSYITNPRRKYWDRKANAEKAINAYNRRYANKEFITYHENRGMYSTLELVTFELVEVKE